MKGLRAGVVLLLFVFAFSSIVSAAARDNVLIIGTTDRITELSPANSYDYWTWHTFADTTDNLVMLPPNSTELGPGLAKSWEVSDDGTVYTFHLREGVTYTDGSPFNAETMKWSLERALRLDGPKGGVGLIKMIKDLKAVDELTLQITINEPDATFLARLADQIGPAMAFSPESTPADEFAKGEYAGTGPYKLIEYVPEERTIYEAYEGYWGEAPKCRRVINVFYSDASALRAAVESGAVDVAYRTFNPEDIIDLESNPNLQVIKGEVSLSVRYMVFNVTQEPFDDPRVRRAIAYAVDRETLVNNVFSGLNNPLYSMVPPGLWSHIDAFPKRDLAKAKELLAELGYDEDNKLSITLWYTPNHYGTTEADVASVLAVSLEETGVIDVDVQSLEWGAYAERMAEGSLGMFLLGWYPDFIDPDNFLAPWLTEAPVSLGTHLNNATSEADKAAYQDFQELLGAAKATVDREERAKLYEEAQKLLAETSVLVPLWQNNSQHVAVAQKNVKGIVLDATMNFRTWLIDK